jgi:Tfp pilus assembly protein PilZ
MGGVFVSTPDPVAVASSVSLLFSVPEGEIRAQAVVRNVKPGEGMGVQFTALGGQDTARLRKLLERLLARSTGAEA